MLKEDELTLSIPKGPHKYKLSASIHLVPVGRMMVNGRRKNTEIMGWFRIKGQIQESSSEESALVLLNVDETYMNLKNLYEKIINTSG